MPWVNRARMTKVVPVVTASRAPAVVRAVSMAIVPMESDVCHDRMAKGVLLEHVSRTGHEHPLISDPAWGAQTISKCDHAHARRKRPLPGAFASRDGKTAVRFAL